MACPEVMVTVAARVAEPSVKVMVPVGVPAPGATALTVAVKVTAWPKTDGSAVELTVVLLEAWLTTCGEVESAPVEVKKFVSPEYRAVTV